MSNMEFFELLGSISDKYLIEYQDHNGYEDRYVYAVMKDGSRIPLHTHGTGDQLTAESPLVLSEVDHILLGDGGMIPMP